MKRLFPILSILLTSCDLLIDVNIPNDNANRVVTNAVQNADSVWTVHLSRSNHILSPLQDTFLPIDRADVVIHNPDGTTESLELLRAGSGTFKGKTRPQRGLKYKVTIDPFGMEHVEAEMTMPSVVPIANIEFDSAQITSHGNRDFFYSAYLPFTLSFNDPAGERNFYKVEAIVYKRVTHGPPGQQKTDTIAFLSRVVIKDPAIATKEDYRQRFTDKTFDGKTYVAPLATSFWSFPDETVIYIEIKLESLSAEYFRYEESASLSFEVMGDPFAQPVQVYSNMSNGFGLFTGGSYDSRKYYIPEEP